METIHPREQRQRRGVDVSKPPTRPLLRNVPLSATGQALVSRRVTLSLSKDSWVRWRVADEAISCVNPDNNNDDTDLRVERETVLLGTAVDYRDAYLGADLSSIPSTATLLAARLTLKPTAAGAADSMSLGTIAGGDEGWTEAGLTCGNRPLPSFAQTFVLPTASNAFTIALGASILAALQGRLGTTSGTVVLAMRGAADAARTFEDRESSPNGPVLELDYWLQGEP